METDKNCPKCGGVIEWDDTYDFSFDVDSAVEYHCGHCKHCKTDYQWTSHYMWTHDSKLEES